VEDDDDTRDLLREMFASAGFEVTTAATAAEGLNAISTSVFDLILSDYRLPDGSGTSMLQVAREFGLLESTTPIVICTAEPDVLEGTGAMITGWRYRAK